MKSLIFSLHIVSMAAVRFECSFNEVPVVYLDTVYTCIATVLYDDGDSSSLTAVEGEHLGERSGEDVRFLRIYLQDLPKLPKDIEKFFPSLDGLMVSTSDLQEIEADDLRPFPQLKILFLNYNPLKSLDGDLLSHTPNLVSVELRNNAIEHVGPGFLENLLELEFLQEINLSGNLCIDIHVRAPSEIPELLSEIQELCPPMEPTDETTTTEEIPSSETTTENAPECTCTPRNSRAKRRRFTLSVVRPV